MVEEQCDICKNILEAIENNSGKKLTVDDVQKLRDNDNIFDSDDVFYKSYDAAVDSILKGASDEYKEMEMTKSMINYLKDSARATTVLPIPTLAKFIDEYCICDKLSLTQTKDIKTIFGVSRIVELEEK